MKDEPNLECRQTREALQEALDSGVSLPASAEAHLEQCSGCRRFQDFLAAIGADLKNDLDARLSAAGAPDVSALVGRRKFVIRKRRIAFALSGLAAAAVIGLTGLLTLTLTQREQTKSFVREETRLFVDGLFSEPVFEGIEFLMASE